MHTRKNFKSLTNAEKAAYIKGVKALKSSGQYDWYVNIHGQTMLHNTAHQSPVFLPWHRQFLWMYEAALAEVLHDQHYALPYWDWAADAALPDPKSAAVWGTDFMGGDGDPAKNNVVTTGPFQSGQWTLAGGGSLVRAFGQNVPTLPTQADVDAVLAVTSYDSFPWNTDSGVSGVAGTGPSFRNQLEGWINQPQLHNRVHVWVGGSMLPMTSPDDPVFFLHHCNIDRIWAQWQQKYPASSYLPTTGNTGHNLTDPMWPWNAGNSLRAPVHVLNCGLLGYQYDMVKAPIHYPTILPIGPLTYRVEGVASQGQMKIEPVPPYFMPPRVMPDDPVRPDSVLVYLGFSANAQPMDGWLDYKYGLLQASTSTGPETTTLQGEFTDHFHGKGTLITTRSDDGSVKVYNWVAGD